MSKQKWLGSRPADIDRMIQRAQKAGLPIRSLETLEGGRVKVTIGEPDVAETPEDLRKLV